MDDKNNQAFPLAMKERRRKKLDEIVLGLSAAKKKVQEKSTNRDGLCTGNNLSLPVTTPIEFLDQLKLCSKEALRKSGSQRSISKGIAFEAGLNIPKFDLFTQDAKVNQWLAENSNLQDLNIAVNRTSKRKDETNMDALLLASTSLSEESMAAASRRLGKKVLFKRNHIFIYLLKQCLLLDLQRSLNYAYYLIRVIEFETIYRSKSWKLSQALGINGLRIYVNKS